MAEVASAVVALMPSFRGGAAAISKELDGPITRSADKTGRTYGSRLASGAKAMLGPLLAAVSAGAVASFFSGAIEEASGLNESLNALSVTYGENADAVANLGQQAADKLGLSNLEFNNLAVRFSSFANTIAGEGGNVTGTLDDLTSRAADFASVMNLDVADAAALFQSGLAGESEPLRQYGIDLSAASVSAYAYANGIAESGEQLTEAQRVQAAYGSIMEQTAATQGDFTNTSDQLANQQRILQARLADSRAELGAAFLPALTAVTTFLANNVQPAFAIAQNAIAGIGPAFESFKTVVSGAIDQLRAPVRRLIDAFSPIVAAVRPLFDSLTSGFGSAATAASSAVPSFDQVVAAIGTMIDGVASAVTWLVDHSAQIRTTAAVVAGVLTPVLIRLGVQWTITGAAATRSGIAQAAAWVMTQTAGARAAAMFIVSTYRIIAGWVLMGLRAMANAAIQVAAWAILGAASAIHAARMAASWVAGVIAPAATATAAMVANVARQVAAWVVLGVQSLIQAARVAAAWLIAMGPVGIVIAIVVGLVALIIANWDKIKAVTERVWGAIISWLSARWESIRATAVNIWNAVVSFFTGIPGRVRSALSGILGVVSTVTGWFANMRQGAIDRLTALVTWVRGIPNRILSALGNMRDLLYNAGAQILSGFLSGLQSGWSAVTGWVGGIGSWIADNKGPKSYDLALLRPAGQWIITGLRDGLEDEKENLGRTLQGVSDVIAGQRFAASSSFLGSAIPASGVDGGVAPIQMTINPQPGMSEEAIGASAARQLNFAMQG